MTKLPLTLTNNFSRRSRPSLTSWVNPSPFYSTNARFARAANRGGCVRNCSDTPQISYVRPAPRAKRAVLLKKVGAGKRSVEGEFFVSVNGSFVMSFPMQTQGIDTLEWQNCHFAHEQLPLDAPVSLEKSFLSPPIRLRPPTRATGP